LWPESKVAVVESRDQIVDFPGLPAAGRALDSYELRLVGSDRIAGHQAEVLILKPRDGHRFAQRLWTERETGLLLRSDVLGPRGELLESSTFTDVQLGGKAHPEAVLAPMRRLEGYRVLRPATVRAQLDAEGWAMPKPVPGFQLVGCSKRPLDVAAEDNGEPRQVLHAVYSDGLTHVSIFIEPFDAQRHKPMRTSLGATHTLMNRRGEWWVTVVGEVPMDTVQQFDAMLERKR
jgi:sigma-E factor negative regulatory protein RseB